MSTALCIGVIGGGQAYRRLYVPALGEVPGLTIAALADPAVASGANYASADDMLSAETLDGVIVLSPPALHAEHIALACERSVPVLVEKPAALSVSEVEAWRHPELVTPAFSRRYWQRYRERARPGHRWRYRLCTNPAAWGSLAREPVERDLLPHAADLAIWLSGEAIESIDCVRRPNQASGSFVLSAGGIFEWAVEHGDIYSETLDCDGLPYRRSAALSQRLLRRVLRRPAEDAAAIAEMLGEWSLRVRGMPTTALGSGDDARSCAKVIETVERMPMSTGR